MKAYLAGVQAYLPLDAIQAQLQQSPHLLDQGSLFTQEDAKALLTQLESEGIDKEFLERLKKTEIFKNREE